MDARSKGFNSLDLELIRDGELFFVLDDSIRFSLIGTPVNWGVLIQIGLIRRQDGFKSTVEHAQSPGKYGVMVR